METHTSEKVSHSIGCYDFHPANLNELFLLDISVYEQLKLLTLSWKDDRQNMKELGIGFLEFLNFIRNYKLHRCYNLNIP